MAEALERRLAALEAELAELRDREAIREVIHRYCQAVDRCDLEMLKSCYHPDGYDDHGFFAGNAHEFAEYVIPCLERIDSSMHSITNTRFRFDGDRCATTSQWSVVHRLPHEAGFADFWHQGRYLDVWESATASGSCSIASWPATWTAGSRPSISVRECSTAPISRCAAVAARRTPGTSGLTCWGIGPSGRGWRTFGRGFAL